MKQYIRRFCLWLITLMCIISIAFAIWGADRRNYAHDNHAFSFEHSDAYNTRACGPICLKIAAARLGKALDITNLIRDCELNEKGASMLRLKQVAEMYGLQADGVKLTWQDLAKTDAPVILYVNSNHYCCVDPRETNPDNNNEVKMYYPGKMSEWISENDINTSWHGESLIIRRKERQITENVPRMEYDNLLVDFGSIEPCEVLKTRFAFKNTGSAPLRIGQIKKSCGCTTATVSKSILNPGEDGEISLFLAAQGRAGYQNLSVYVESNDPISTTTELQYTGVINATAHVSKSILDYGDVYPGQETSQDIELTERDGKQNLMIEGIEIKYDQIEKKEYLPIAQIRTVPQTKVSETIDAVLPAKRSIESLDGKPIKYRITIRITMPRNVPYGPIKGTLEIATKIRGNPDIRVPVTMNVVNDIYIVPNNINIGVLKPNEHAVKTFVIKRHSGKPVKVVKSLSECVSQGSNLSAEIKIKKEETDQTTMELTVHRSSDEKAMSNVVIKGIIKTNLYSGEEMKCEWKGFSK